MTSPSATMGLPRVAEPPARTSTSQGETRLSDAGVLQLTTTPSSSAVDNTVSTVSDFTFAQNHVAVAAAARETVQIAVSNTDARVGVAVLDVGTSGTSTADRTASISRPEIPHVTETVRNLILALPRK